MRLGRSSLQFDDVYGGFLLGLGALLALLVIVSAAGQATHFSSGAAPALLLFFATSLVSLSLARILEAEQQAQQQARLGHGHQLPLSGRWLAVLSGLVVAILLLSVLLSSIVSFSALQAILSPLASALGWLSNGLFYLLLPLGLLAAGLVYAIQLLISLAGVAKRPQPPQPTDVTQTLRNLQHQNNPWHLTRAHSGAQGDPHHRRHSGCGRGAGKNPLSPPAPRQPGQRGRAARVGVRPH